MWENIQKKPFFGEVKEKVLPWAKLDLQTSGNEKDDHLAFFSYCFR